MVDLLQSHSFKCIENLKPNDVIFVNQKDLENKENIKSNETLIKNFLEEQITKDFDAKRNWWEETKIDENLGELEYQEEEFDQFFDNIKKFAENQEIELKQEIENVKSNEEFNNTLNINLEKAFKESVFEYRIIGLVVNNKEDQKLESKKKKLSILSK